MFGTTTLRVAALCLLDNSIGKTLGLLNAPKGGGNPVTPNPQVDEETDFATPALDGNYLGCYH